MLNWFRKAPTLKAPYLTYPEHYEQTLRQAQGVKQRLSLINAELDGTVVAMTYRWTAELSHEEADRLDTRARAYVTCAIYDAATTAGIACQPGPPHGQRPSWILGSERMPISLINAGFDLAEKTCFMHIGQGLMVISGPSGGGRYAKKLVAGFRTQFAKIDV